MGNKLGGARERTSDFVGVLRGRPKRSPSAHEGEGHTPRPVSASAPQRGFSTQRGKLNSCPDLVRGPATDSPRWKKSEDQPTDDKKYDIKIYRSYTDLPGDMPKRLSCSEIPTVEVRVYRRSTERLAPMAPGKAQSLPRGMERTLAAASVDLSCSFDSRHGASSIRDSNSIHDYRSSRRGSSRCSTASAIYFKVSPEEFPNAVTVKKKVAEFEKNFVSILTKTFQQLPPLNQLSALSVATRPDRVNQSVSLLQYFESESIPADLGVQNHDSATTGNREYYLTISKDRLQEIKKVKMEGLADQKLEVARDILVDMAKEAASELGRMFEYQVALVNESIAMRLLARHAVNCVLYMVKKRNRILDRNSIVIGAVRGRPKVPEGAPKFISVIIGSKELKWNLYEIFKKSALRKELLPNTALVDSCCSASMVGGPEDESAHCPWKFFTSSESEPMLYGYRSQMVEWDYVNGFFRLNSEEEAVFSEGIFWRYDDFHRVYCPYARLVGFDTVQSYCSGAASCNTTPSVCSGNGNGKDHALVRSISGFTEFVRQSKSGTYIRDEIQLVYRPLGVADFIELDKIDFAGEPVVRYDNGAAVSVGAGGKNPANKALLRSTAMEVTRECDELCHKLKAMDDRARSKCDDDDEDGPLSGAEHVNGEQSRCSFFADKLNELTNNCLNDDDPKTITDV